jgi:hypothetical protein
MVMVHMHGYVCVVGIENFEISLKQCIEINGAINS